MLPLTEDEFKSIYSRVPRLCVDLVIKNKGKLLLTLRQKYGYAGWWHLPGGTVYYREALADAAKRIAFEECGIEIKVKNQIGYIEYFSEVKERGFGYTVTIVLDCSTENEKITLNDQASDYKWFSELPDKLIPEQKEFLSK